MFKPIEVTAGEIIDHNMIEGRVRLDDGRVVSERRIRVIADTSVQPEFHDASKQTGALEAHEETVMEAHYREIAEIQAAAAAERERLKHK